MPALHFHETVQNVVPLHIDSRPQQHRDRISEDMYDTLQSFRFGAPPCHPPANEEVDEDERQRGDRAKMRAIDDGTRRPSLPTNSGTPIAPRSHASLSSLSSTTSAGIVVGERQLDEHSEPNWDMVMGDTTPTKASSPPPPTTSDAVSMHTELRRPSVPIAIPMLRRRSRSAGELAVDFEQRMRGSTPTQATLSTSTPLYSWVDSRRQSRDYTRDTSSSPEENAYDGYDLNFILSQNTAGGDSRHHSSTGVLRGRFRSKHKTAVQSRLEDTFMRHIMDADPVHKQRQDEWTFRREATSGSPKGKDKDKSVGEVDCWRCEWVGKFNVHRLQNDSRNTTSSGV